MKVKIISRGSPSTLESEINEFLETGVKVLNMYYSSGSDYSEVMIVYEEFDATKGES